MKIINPAFPNLRLVREAHLDQYLSQLLDKVRCPEQQSIIAQPFDTKDEWRRVLEGTLALPSSNDPTNRTYPIKSTEFQKFVNLPVELRLQIWELAFVLDERRNVIHCVDERGGRFISNQPIPPALHACHEARDVYFSHRSRERTTFAFGSYIEFELDTVYLIDYEDKEEKFQRFLESPSAKQIRNLAMRKSLACAIPMEGHMSQVQWDMMEFLEAWGELKVVFHDERTMEEVWHDVGMQLRDLSAREKRRHAEIGYARALKKTLNGMMRSVEVPEMRYSFVRVVEGGGLLKKDE